MFGETINLLYRRIPYCDVETATVPCDVTYQTEADSMRDKSFELAIYWAIIAVGCVIGNMLTFYGFGMCDAQLKMIHGVQWVLRLFLHDLILQVWLARNSTSASAILLSQP